MKRKFDLLLFMAQLSMFVAASMFVALMLGRLFEVLQESGGIQ